MTSPTLQLTLDWRSAADPAPEAQQEQTTQVLARELMAVEGVAAISRVPAPDLPDGAMGATWLLSILTADLTMEGIKALLPAVVERLPGKTMEISIKGKVAGK